MGFAVDRLASHTQSFRAQLSLQLCNFGRVTPPSMDGPEPWDPHHCSGIGGNKRLRNGGEPALGLKSGNIGGLFSREET